MLSLVGDPLSGNGCGSPNHTYSLSYFFLVYFPVLQLTQKKARSHLHATLFSFDCPHPLPATSHYLIQIPLHTTPPIYHQRSANIRCQIKLTIHGHKPSATEASKLNYYSKWLATARAHTHTHTHTHHLSVYNPFIILFSVSIWWVFSC